MNQSLRRIAFISILGMSLVLAAGPCFGQSRSSISGFVFGPNRTPVGNIYVELANEYGSVLSRVRTDGSGRFFFSGLGQGRFVVKALPMGTGYEEQSADIEIAGIGVRGQALGENVQKDLYLKLRRGADAVPFQNAVVYAQDVPKEAETLYKNAVSDLDSQRVESGIASLERAVAAFPTYFAALQRLGTVRLSQERYADAADVFKRALAVNDRSFDCWYGLSYAYYSSKQFPDSVGAAEKAVTNRSDSVEATLLLGMSLRVTKDLEKAEHFLKLAAKISDNTSADAHWQLALLYGKDMQRYADAAKSLESYLKVFPDAPNKAEIKKLIIQFRDKAKTSS